MNWIKLSEREPPLGKRVILRKMVANVWMSFRGELYESIKYGRIMWNVVGFDNLQEKDSFTYWAEIVPPESEAKSDN